MNPEIFFVLVAAIFAFPLAAAIFGFVLLVKVHIALKMFPPVNALNHASKTSLDVEDASGVMISDDGFSELDEETQMAWLKEQIGEKNESELREIFREGKDENEEIG